MYDRDLVREILSQILKALDTVIYRFEPVKTLADFSDSPTRMEKLDAICMQLIAIGESLKNVDKITIPYSPNIPRLTGKARRP